MSRLSTSASDSQKTGVALLPEERQEELGKQVSASYEKLHKLMNEFPRWRRDVQNVIKEVGSEALRLIVGHLQGRKGILLLILVGYNPALCVSVVKWI